MGTFYYGDARYPIKLEDRTLAHLKIVILTKLRRNECFAFSWAKKSNDGSGHGTVWIHPALAFHFEFLGSKEVPINLAWLESMSECANRALGLTIGDEPRSPAAGDGVDAVPRKSDPVSYPEPVPVLVLADALT
ncbi:hypothetical protein GCM10027413_24930 [Conyzicola nivalis]|uniref:DUF7882 domain-containing protein n=1 Tax=Conyzicola nivalis TaxID=1477021 RepID=A0A916SAG0_9MICO|nr:hypothetical protein [Conyzicola nivalis]GGA90654.1 hypothetical protein GCM10010979_01690 [Conyzicola nivalis]